MDKDFDKTMVVLQREADRLGFAAQQSYNYDLIEIRGLDRPSQRANLYFRREVWEAWAYDVTVNLHVSMDESRKLECSAELSWSSTGRSVSMAVAVLALYQRAVEFASLAECLLTGVVIPIQETEGGREK